MATNYPGSIDSLTNPSAGDPLTSPSHAAQHANANDAIEAIETELGTDPSGAAATVKARIAAVESTANSAVQPGDLAAVATSGDYDDLSDKPTSMTPTAHKTSHATGGTDALSPADIGAATAAQGAKADTAVQPGSLSTVATTGAYSDLSGKPTLGTAAATDASAYATAAQGTKADGAAQKASNLSDLANTATALSNIGGTPTSRTITAGTGLTGGGDLSANRTLSVTGLTNNEIASGAAIATSKLADLPYNVVVPGTVQPNDSTGVVTSTYLAASLYNSLISTASGLDKYFEWTVWLNAGTYTLRTCWRSGTNATIITISVDGSDLGTTIDTYAATAANNNITDITSISLTAGKHAIRFKAASKNASSSGYAMNLHGFSLTRTGA